MSGSVPQVALGLHGSQDGGGQALQPVSIALGMHEVSPITQARAAGPLTSSAPSPFFAPGTRHVDSRHDHYGISVIEAVVEAQFMLPMRMRCMRLKRWETTLHMLMEMTSRSCGML